MTAWTDTAAMFLSCGVTFEGTTTPSCASMFMSDWMVKGAWLVWSPVPFKPTTRPYPTSWLVRTPCTCAMSLMRSAWTNEAASQRTVVMQIRWNGRKRHPLPRAKDGVEEPPQPAHAVGAVDDALAGVADVRIGELVGGHGVVGRDVRRPYHSGDVDELIALIELQALVALHHQIAVALHIGDRHGEAAHQAVALRGGT